MSRVRGVVAAFPRVNHLTFDTRHIRYLTAWTTRHRKDPYGKTDRQDVECARAKDREWPRDLEQVRRSVRGKHPKALRGCGERGLFCAIGYHPVY